MISVNKLIQKIKDEKVGPTGKKVLLLEGADDVDAFSLMLNKKVGNLWEQNWTLAFAEGKKRILEVLQIEPTWIGLVDRDEWNDVTIAEKQGELPNLVVLPRFCLENYLLDPDELWEGFPQEQKNKIGGGVDELRAAIFQEKDKWLRHGVLWSVVNPLWDGLRSLGFKEDLLDVENAQDDEAIRQKLKEWYDYLEHSELFRLFTEQLQVASADSPTKQLHVWIHGKKFYINVIHVVLNRLLGQKNADERKMSIFRTRALPDDLAPLWARMGI